MPQYNNCNHDVDSDDNGNNAEGGGQAPVVVAAVPVAPVVAVAAASASVSASQRNVFRWIVDCTFEWLILDVILPWKCKWVVK